MNLTKKLLAALLLLGLLSNSAIAATQEETLSDQDLRDYYLFDSGTWWDFIYALDYSPDADILNDINLVDNTSDATGRTESAYCRITDCAAYEMNGVRIEYIVEEDQVVMREFAHQQIDDVTIIDLNGFDRALEPFDLILLGYDPEGYYGNKSCYAEFTDNYEYLDGYYGDLIDYSCYYEIFESDTQNPDQIEITETTYLLENVGPVYADLAVYVDKAWQYTLYMLLSDTSLELEDVLVSLSEDTEVTLAEEDTTVTDTTVTDTSDVENPFSDLGSTHKNYDALIGLYANNIISGYDDGSVHPNSSLNRAELLKILVEGLGITPDADEYANCFPDVGTEWFAKYVCYAKEAEWVNGYDDGYFRPANTINKVEAVKMLLNSQSVDLDTPTTAPYMDVLLNEWFTPFVSTAKGLGLLEEEGSTFEPAAEITRGGIAEILWRLLTS